MAFLSHSVKFTALFFLTVGIDTFAHTELRLWNYNPGFGSLPELMQIQLLFHTEWSNVWYFVTWMWTDNWPSSVPGAENFKGAFTIYCGMPKWLKKVEYVFEALLTPIL